MVEALREVYALAQQLGVRMALEPLNRFETYFLNRADQGLALSTDGVIAKGTKAKLFAKDKRVWVVEPLSLLDENQRVPLIEEELANESKR